MAGEVQSPAKRLRGVKRRAAGQRARPWLAQAWCADRQLERLLCPGVPRRGLWGIRYTQHSSRRSAIYPLSYRRRGRRCPDPSHLLFLALASLHPSLIVCLQAHRSLARSIWPATPSLLLQPPPILSLSDAQVLLTFSASTNFRSGPRVLKARHCADIERSVTRLLQKPDIPPII